MEGFIAKYSEKKRSELSKDYGILWESDEEIEHCRYCTIKFKLLIRKHHCRYCGGIYCQLCCIGTKLKCLYCYNGLNCSLYLLDLNKSISQFSNFSNSIHNIFIRLKQPKLQYGSLYDKNFIRLNNEIAHKNGYFQITNRSDLKCCAVKILSEGCNIYHEIFRPPYLPLPPKESAYCLIENYKIIYILYLYDNPIQATEGMTIIYNTINGEDLSPCAAPKNFRKFRVYKVVSRGKNVLLKYTDLDELELRSGQGRRIKYKAAGIFSDFMKSMTNSTSSNGNNGNNSGNNNNNTNNNGLSDSVIVASTLDFETNVEDVEFVVEG